MGEVIRPKNPLAIQRHVNGILHADHDFEKTEIVQESVRVIIHSGRVASAVRMNQLLKDRSVECSVDFVDTKGQIIALPTESEPERPVLRHGSDSKMDILSMLDELQDVTEAVETDTATMNTVGTKEMSVVHESQSDEGFDAVGQPQDLEAE